MMSRPAAATALISEDDTVTCLLKEGRTDFVVELPKATTLDRLTFVNKNSLARGELKIAMRDGSRASLTDPSQFKGYRGPGQTPDLILLKHNGLHIEIHVDRNHRIGKTDLAGMLPGTSEAISSLTTAYSA